MKPFKKKELISFNKHFGIIGNPLSHTQSPSFFNKMFEELGIDAEYSAYPLDDIQMLKDLLTQISFAGMNVTIPYKQEVLLFLDELDADAREMGAVNCIAFRNNKLIGYNTDAYGFEKSLLQQIENPQNIDKALILGTGGAAKAVAYTLQKLNISFDFVSRKHGDFSYDQLNSSIMADHHLIINTTPLGMSPNIHDKPDLPYQYLTESHFLYDLIYNPAETAFMKEGKARHSNVKNGQDMFILQAQKNWEIWNEKP